MFASAKLWDASLALNKPNKDFNLCFITIPWHSLNLQEYNFAKATRKDNVNICQVYTKKTNSTINVLINPNSKYGK